jgi:hypothetical protein
MGLMYVTVRVKAGVTQLESAGITIDPVNQTLKRLPAISLRSAALSAV